MRVLFRLISLSNSLSEAVSNFHQKKKKVVLSVYQSWLIRWYKWSFIRENNSPSEKLWLHCSESNQTSFINHYILISFFINISFTAFYYVYKRNKLLRFSVFIGTSKREQLQSTWRFNSDQANQVSLFSYSFDYI